jgi:parallel beta-helix repeat protein
MKRMIFGVVAILSANLCFGGIVNVPGGQPNIQAGLDAANTYDTVLVGDGTFTGDGNRDIDFGGKAVVLMSENGPEFTTIDCEAGPSDAHWAFYFDSDEDRSSVVSGFTMTNAFTDEQGAIFISSSSPTIEDCIIMGNDCSGIRVHGYGSYPLVDGCVISHNTCHGVSVADILWPTANIEMLNSLVYGNSMSGLQIFSAEDVIVTNCTFASNGGAGIHIEGDPPNMGPGRDPTRVISNCISAFNSGPGIERVFFDSPYLFYCNDSYGNGGGDFVNVDAYWGDPNGNFSLHPLFCPAEWDYHIHSGSPCAPSNNDCETLIGALDIGCSDIYCGDIKIWCTSSAMLKVLHQRLRHSRTAISISAATSTYQTWPCTSSTSCMVCPRVYASLIQTAICPPGRTSWLWAARWRYLSASGIRFHYRYMSPMTRR